jgi:predicted amino acid dehydrogenase
MSERGHRMETVVCVSLGSSRLDYDFVSTFLGETIRIVRLGADGDEARARDILRRWAGNVGAVALGGVRGHGNIGTRHFPDPVTTRLEREAGGVPVATGARLRRILYPWAVRYAQAELGGHFTNARVLVLSGRDGYDVAAALSEMTRNLLFADPVLELGIPKLLTSLGGLELYAAGTHPVLDWVPEGSWLPALPLLGDWRSYLLRKAMQSAHVVVGSFHALRPYGLEELAGKTVLTSALDDSMLESLRVRGVNVAVDGTPRVLERIVSLAVLEALILATRGASVADDELLELVEELRMHPRILPPAGSFRKVNRFAFVIHPLSQEYFRKVEAIDMISRVTPEGFLGLVERVMSHAPPIVYSRVSGIRSPAGVEAEGWLISVGGTPREILSHPPEFTYRRLLDAAKIAERLGAQIMGLGAFTKVVGDAGVTVARRATIPITSGNSYTVSAALWAAREATRRLGFVTIEQGKKIAGKAMVIGATGSIGAACARILSVVVDEVHLVSPELGKLLALEEELRAQTPGARVHVAEHPGETLREMDLIITATSAAGARVLEIDKVKPGCVICDVARPLDISAEQAAKRPDVLVIESGEIEVPGELEIGDVGLPRNVVWACLAEVIVLALEGRFEPYTIGRAIDPMKVRAIYRLGLKHGMRLAAMSGVKGIIDEREFERVRDLALRNRAVVEAPAPATEQAKGASG